jgi:flagellar protein FliO/FliZ
MQPRARNVGGLVDSLRFVRALPVGPKVRVVIVVHRGARWMLGVTAGGISTIAQWPADAQMPAEPTVRPLDSGAAGL